MKHKQTNAAPENCRHRYILSCHTDKNLQIDIDIQKGMAFADAALQASIQARQQHASICGHSLVAPPVLCIAAVIDLFNPLQLVRSLLLDAFDVFFDA